MTQIAVKFPLAFVCVCVCPCGCGCIHCTHPTHTDVCSYHLVSGANISTGKRMLSAYEM